MLIIEVRNIEFFNIELLNINHMIKYSLVCKDCDLNF